MKLLLISLSLLFTTLPSLAGEVACHDQQFATKKADAFEFIECQKSGLGITLNDGKFLSAQKLFANTVTIGASVSKGYTDDEAAYPSLEPLAERLNKRFNPSKRGLAGNFARSYYSSLDLENTYFDKEVPTEIKNASVVIGMDLFFWDTVPRKNPGCKVEQVKRMLDRFKPNPAFIGEVPMLKSGTQDNECIVKINQAIKTECKLADNCHMMSLPSNLYADKNLLQDDHLHFTNYGYEAIENYFCQSQLTVTKSEP